MQDQYTDLPYPPFTREDEIQEKMAYLEHTLCFDGKCEMISNNNLKNHPYVISLELDLLNALLYKVWYMKRKKKKHYGQFAGKTQF